MGYISLKNKLSQTGDTQYVKENFYPTQTYQS